MFDKQAGSLQKLGEGVIGGQGCVQGLRDIAPDQVFGEDDLLAGDACIFLQRVGERLRRKIKGIFL